MNDTNTITTHQFDYMAPRTLSVAGKQYTRAMHCLFDDSTDTMHFDFVAARRQRGAALKSKIRVSASYDAGLDLYSVDVVHFDGKTFDDRVLFSNGGMYSEAFARLADFIA